MPSLVDEIVEALGPQVAQQMSSHLGIDRNTAARILPQVVPLVLGGLKRQMEQRGGAPRVDHILNKYGNPDVLQDIGGLFGRQVRNQNADPRLGGLLGESGVQAAGQIAQRFGLNMETAMKIIPMLAPLILGLLTQKRDATGLGSQGLAALLDQDGDGNILDDVASFFMRGLGGGQSGQSGGGLGDLLGAVLGGGRR
ncbi:MAG: DUF937 domain-containing protein [candidate division KSB1 bacterium]|nr:DUF937 domain-containing protein [candidate division KSB1 bacterium]MDZ7274037.1 DUF937 domain-containing protein [candidate division KSB1 bacterium]MDZ7286410.1 DUF937 domain-containing protein [candidate division KSB1 bacterium]MDZ7296638.1 DUF937 domain-containing protein [candidate division KSB1 bacterium]MDZ7306860.1 DUF937 domain-containing protein [candidate division KSB1 bacterium]